MKSLKCSVDVLYTLSDTILGECLCSSTFENVYLGFLLLTVWFTAVPACEIDIRWHCNPTRRMSPLPIPSAYPRDSQVSQTVKDVSAGHDALVDLFFEIFLGRLSIYTGIPATLALTNVLVKIVVGLLSTLALATK